MENILWLLLAHYVCDYPLQGDFLAQTKGKYLYSLFAHSMIYGLGISLILNFLGTDYIVLKAILLVLSHMCIDSLKANAKNEDKALTTYLYLDQISHILINIILYYL